MLINKIKKTLKKNGAAILELLVVMGLMAILLPALLTGLYTARSGKAQQSQRVQAVAILKETQEAVRNIRNQGWNNIATNGTFYPTISSSNWTLVACSGTCPQTADGFDRSVTISDVYRNASGVIVPSGNLDPSTKKILITVGWGAPLASSTDTTLYLTRYNGNASYTDTYLTDFNETGNIQDGVTVRNTNPSPFPNDGEILLGAGGRGDWCSPTLLGAFKDLPGSGSQASLMALEGKAFVGTGGNASGDSLDYVTWNNPPYPTPPTISLPGTYNHRKSNGVFGDQAHAYLTSDHPTLSVDIVNISTFVSNGTATGASGTPLNIFVLNNNGYNIAYVSTSSHLVTYDFTTRTGGHLPKAALALASNGPGNKVVAMSNPAGGNLVYVAVGKTTNQLQIYQVNDAGTTISSVRNIALPAQGAKDLYINSSRTRAYVITALSATAGVKEFFIVDIDPASATYGQVKGSYDTNGMNPNGITIVPGNVAVLGGSGGEEYQILNINTESAPARCGGIDLGALIIYQVDSILEADGDAYSYILTSDATHEFRMIEGGPGGTYSVAGTYESATFAAPYQTANNNFIANFSRPSNTVLQFQISLANMVGPTPACPEPTPGNYTFIGPDGTSSSYFSPNSGEASVFPFVNYGNYSNPGQCFRYKIIMSTSDNTQTPVLSDITVNYSP